MSLWLQQAVAAQRGAFALAESDEQLFKIWPAQDSARLCAIAAHSLRHAGKPVAAWQPWLALSAAGHLELQDFGLARALSVLARVYTDLADRLPAMQPRLIEHRSLNYVLGLGGAPPLPDAARLSMIEQGFDSLTYDDGFGQLADAITRHDWAACRAAFELLAGFALEGAEVRAWDAEFSPGYEPVPAALAAVARDAGFALDSLAPATREWLWPAVESRPRVVPVRWPPPKD